MTRIIAGTAGGRALKTPGGRGTRPTSDRVREALFSALDARDAVAGARVLDLYAGSGALGLEAASRGASEVTLVEHDRSAAALIRTNAAALGLRATVLATTVSAALGGAGTPARERSSGALGGARTAYDLVLLDPPYDLPEDALATDLATLADRGWLADDALVLVERSKRSPEPAWPDGLEPERRKAHGDTVIWWARWVPDARPDRAAST
ncbi:16S rRNA (guanine966-N2)-methyltransferase [Knoellia remsis]|uniref:16S rRNA (Guanine966-N2)-methyltransferase n=1 Tax=Knoellia remsis TaxID=407159 RepID=A0A2T0UZG0_9MICO|nr:16S rRNA (guanine(966)-N(2))-methyltransferase RsmD [Knoellia remsis]PRY63247.1 16S rRNA (guanine966-N2)-methyltransferase [Knoellia remsis]